MKLFQYAAKFSPLIVNIKQYSQQCHNIRKPRHLICFKQWTEEMVMGIINSAINLKCCFRDTHNQRLNVLSDSKVMILQEINEPVLNMAVSKAATLLGAYDVHIIDNLVWDQDYLGRVFSFMSDAIFVATSTHMCVQRFADQSSVPVTCMKSRTHASIQSLSTVMSIIEEFGTLKGVNISYLGAPHPVLNSYLLLCPMLGANIRFKCCCKKCPVSPLLFKASEEISSKSYTEMKECLNKDDVLKNACVVIAGPTTNKQDKIDEFRIGIEDIEKQSCCHWIFFHTCPRGKEVDDVLFNHWNARTFNVFENMHFIAAALMAYGIKNYTF